MSAAVSLPVTAARQRAAGPLRRVLAAFEAGAANRADLTRVTGLDGEVVDAALDHLVRLGRVQTSASSASCPPAGCQACPAGRPGEASGCGAAPPASPAVACLVSLVPRRAE